MNSHWAKDFPFRYDAILLGEPEQEFFPLFDQISLNGSAAADCDPITRSAMRRGDASSFPLSFHLFCLTSIREGSQTRILAPALRSSSFIS